jgi:hypothetical protein
MVMETLTDQQVEALNIVGRRLAAELRATIAAVSPTDLSIRQLASKLGIDPTVCQRVIGAARMVGEPLEAIRRAPGTAGLMLFVEACTRAGVQASVTGSLEAAVNRLERTTSEMGGSRSQLAARIGDWIAATASPEHRTDERIAAQEAIRRDMFKHAVRWVGNQMDARLGITILRPSPHDAQILQGVALSACVGYRSRPGVGPLTAYVFATSPDPHAPAAGAASEEPHDLSSRPVLLPGFSSAAVRLSARQEAQRLMYVVDIEQGAQAQAVDVAFTVNLPEQPNPAHATLPHYVSSMRQRHPASRCVHYVFLHRSLASVCVAHPGCSAADTRILGDRAGEAWEEHLPCPHRVEMLGVGLGECKSSAWTRAPEAIAHLFTQAGWNPMHFVGFRLDLTYPVWGSNYYIDFDFSPASEG